LVYRFEYNFPGYCYDAIYDDIHAPAGLVAVAEVGGGIDSPYGQFGPGGGIG